jgi:hypothetical protein
VHGTVGVVQTRFSGQVALTVGEIKRVESREKEKLREINGKGNSRRGPCVLCRYYQGLSFLFFFVLYLHNHISVASSSFYMNDQPGTCLVSFFDYDLFFSEHRVGHHLANFFSQSILLKRKQYNRYKS